MPIEGVFKKLTAITAIIKIGLEAMVNDTRRSASIFVNNFSFLMLAVNATPVGNPLAIPIAQIKLPTPGTLKRGRIIGWKRTPIKRTTPNCISSSPVTKNGNKDGKTEFVQTNSPCVLALTVSVGIIRRQNANNTELLANMIELIFAFKKTDRKSTRLNSSHVAISYAVFC